MGVTFTEKQQKVIDTRGCNLLVSAAAGSGKTAVLVERIVKMISEGEHPADIDRLLIVTFTVAAAAEMRERISDAIGRRLTQQPDNEHLQRQMTLLHNAQITTIDSFCLFVIRNHFHTIGLDPGFRIADEGELKLLQADVLGSVLEQCYLEEEEAFLHCMEYFSTGSRDKAVEDAVFKLYDFAMSHPFPEDWLQERKEDYASGSISQEPAWMRELVEETGRLLQGLIDRIGQCIKICEEPDGPYMYGEILDTEYEMLERLAATQTYEERQRMFETVSFGRLSSKRDESVSLAKRELVKNMRGEIKEQLQALQKNYFTHSLEEIWRQMETCKEAVCALVDLTLRFLEAFTQAKRDKNILDFDDIEHFALQILLQKGKDGSIAPTETALEYRSYFEEILMDEYQDSNLVQEYLLSAISKEAEGYFNRFMVGDVKQSIYKFRLARPELFMEKYETYGEVEGQNTLRIDLHKNFRSREEVLISTNTVFSQVMREELGGVVYDEKAALYAGASYPENTVNAEWAEDEEQTGNAKNEDSLNDRRYTEPIDNETELLLFVEKEEEEESADDTPGAKQQEAYGIAREIRKLVTSFQVTDKESGTLRKASYRDIVILLRTTAGWDEEFKRILEEEGIPVHVTSKTGYFATTEIRELLHFLRILDNPLQDIPLYGALHSYFGGFTEEEIATVKAAYSKSRYLYDALVSYAQGGQQASDVSLQEKLRKFLKTITDYREKAVYMPVHEILQTLIREYAYLDYVTAKPGGGRRRANVEMLLVKASDYEKTSYYGMYHFLRYIEQLEKYDVDYGEANLQDENADVVRIMSIHKSKGLEFPICIVAGLGKSFNNRDANSRLVMDMERGIGVDYVNPRLRISSRNLRRNFIAFKLRQDNLAEELRILYVAMTRAKEKLILTGTLKKEKKKVASLTFLQTCRERSIPYDMLLQMGSFLDVLLYAAARNQCFDAVWQTYDIEPDKQNPFYGEDMKLQVSLRQWEETAGGMLQEALWREGNRKKLLLCGAAGEIDRIDQQFLTVLSDTFSYQYPYENLRDLYTKTTVSELKKAGMKEETDFSFPLYEEEQVVPYLPRFIRQEEDVSGTDRGSAYHKVMELFDFTLLTDMVNVKEEANLLSADARRQRLQDIARQEMNRMLAEGKLSQVYYDAVSIAKIAAFLDSDIARRMAAAATAGTLYREQPFVLGLPANRLNEAFPPEEIVLIQGIIDVFFEEAGSYVVVDYKTDAVKTPQELVQRYQTQLDYYGEALEQLSGYKATGQGFYTSAKIIYSFRLGMEILLD
ncbi:MAG: helicase-exonuclease AddAB subunit AddA [Blautia sp.]|nr:helicase-exonuclease AddAB subunit AddA [Lachnoclostridium sp.]MCM1211687.1 helicase-exonuclease AddAB subunit AddA [Blautia sp.]